MFRISPLKRGLFVKSLLASVIAIICFGFTVTQANAFEVRMWALTGQFVMETDALLTSELKALTKILDDGTIKTDILEEIDRREKKKTNLTDADEQLDLETRRNVHNENVSKLKIRHYMGYFQKVGIKIALTRPELESAAELVSPESLWADQRSFQAASKTILTLIDELSVANLLRSKEFFTPASEEIAKDEADKARSRQGRIETLTGWVNTLSDNPSKVERQNIAGGLKVLALERPRDKFDPVRQEINAGVDNLRENPSYDIRCSVADLLDRVAVAVRDYDAIRQIASNLRQENRTKTELDDDLALINASVGFVNFRSAKESITMNAGVIFNDSRIAIKRYLKLDRDWN